MTIATENDISMYNENCREILSLLRKKENDKNLLIKAELHRNLGEFEDCWVALNRIRRAKKYQPLINMINKACILKTKLTVMSLYF
jgi:hypothetical protein